MTHHQVLEPSGRAEIARIADELRRAHVRDPWHGPSARQVMDGITARQAAARPIAGAHTIWELTLHLIAWRREVARRLGGGAPREPEEGDWPAVTDTSDEAWARTVARLDEAHRELMTALERFPDEKLDQRVGPDRDPAAGSGTSYYVMLHGVAQHDAYHQGQISLLRKALQ